MELKDYLAIIGRRFWLFILVTIVITLASLVFSARLPESYDASITVTISEKQSSEIADSQYQYDQYYAIQASSLYADTIMSWLKNPANIQDIYQKADLDLPDVGLSKLNTLIKTKKYQPSSIQLTLSQESQEQVRTLLNSTISFIKQQNQKDIQAQTGENFILSFSDSLVIKQGISLVLNTAVGLVLGLVLGICLVFVVEYFKPKKK